MTSLRAKWDAVARGGEGGDLVSRPAQAVIPIGKTAHSIPWLLLHLVMAPMPNSLKVKTCSRCGCVGSKINPCSRRISQGSHSITHALHQPSLHSQILGTLVQMCRSRACTDAGDPTCGPEAHDLLPLPVLLLLLLLGQVRLQLVRREAGAANMHL